ESRFVRSDTLKLLVYGGLGDWIWWFHGELAGGTEFWDGPAAHEAGKVRADGLAAVALSEPTTDSWFFLRTPDGRAGWWRDVPGMAQLPSDGDDHCVGPFAQ